jgi:hypothetical protein
MRILSWFFHRRLSATPPSGPAIDDAFLRDDEVHRDIILLRPGCRDLLAGERKTDTGKAEIPVSYLGRVVLCLLSHNAGDKKSTWQKEVLIRI